MNANGLMEKYEFQNYIKSVYSYMNDPRFKYRDGIADTFFNEIDTDGNGNISFDEYYLFTNGVLKRA